MEPWVPLFDIFMNSPTPETDASVWLQESFNATTSSSSTTTTPITTSSFLSLLTKPCNVSVKDSSYSSLPTTKRIMFIETLPGMVQSRILSFLALENKRFSGKELSKLARHLLGESQELEFWVKRAARNLLDAVSESNINEWISGFSLDSSEEAINEEFESLPDWLKVVAAANDPLLSWLPLSVTDTVSSFCDDSSEKDEGLFSQVEENGEIDMMEVGEDIEADKALNVPLEPEVEKMALNLRDRVTNFEYSLKAVALANEIRQLCLEKGRDAFLILNLIEPWRAADDTASVLISHLCSGDEEELAWPSQVLCSIVLPKVLVLEEPASRLLVTSTIEYCNLHQKAAVHALLVPLVLRREGINNPICDVITRIVRECLHPAHVSAFCQKLLCGGEEEKRFISLPCHECLVSTELVWTESLFNLFQNILNHNVQLTQDSVDCLVFHVSQMAERFSKSLKFGNFVLCLVCKCASLVKSHKNVLIEAVECTDTLVTKSILSRLASF